MTRSRIRFASKTALVLLAPFSFGVAYAAEPAAAGASGGDPAGATPQEAPAAATIDSNGDGKADAWDRDANGAADAWDTNGDGKPDRFDNDGDGKPDPASASPQR